MVVPDPSGEMQKSCMVIPDPSDEMQKSCVVIGGFSMHIW